MKNHIPIYIISLSRTPERKLHIQRQLDALKLDYQFVDVDAIDKHEMESKTYRAWLAELLDIDKSILENKYTAVIDHIESSYEKGSPTYKNALKGELGALATMLSHIKIYDLMLKNDIAAACILEDDATLLTTFPKVLESAPKLSWDILLLGHQPTFNSSKIRSWDPKSRMMKKIKPTVRRNAPIIKRTIHRYMLWRLFSPSLYPNQSKYIRKIIREEYSHKYKLFIASKFPKKYLQSIAITKYNTYNNIRLGAQPKKASLDAINDHHKYNIYNNIRLGAQPKKASLDAINDHHCIAKPSKMPVSTMAYLVTQSAAMRWKKAVLAPNHFVIDMIPWILYKNKGVKLRLISPPCATATHSYIIYSARRM